MVAFGDNYRNVKMSLPFVRVEDYFDHKGVLLNITPRGNILCLSLHVYFSCYMRGEHFL